MIAAVKSFADAPGPPSAATIASMTTAFRPTTEVSVASRTGTCTSAEKKAASDELQASLCRLYANYGGPAPKQKHAEPGPVKFELPVDVDFEGRKIRVVDWDVCRDGFMWGVASKDGKSHDFPLNVEIDPTNAVALQRDVIALLGQIPTQSPALGLSRTRISRVHLSGDLSRRGGVYCVFLSYDDG